MLRFIKNLSIIVLVGLASLEVKSQSYELLQDIFASAVANHSSPFASLTAVIKPEWAKTKNISSWNATCLDNADNFSAVSTCLQNYAMQCLSLKDLTSLYNITLEKNLSKQDVASLSPALIYSMVSCDNKDLQEMITSEEVKEIEGPTSAASWGYSILFVTLINVCSLTGAIVLPCMKMKIYKLVLMFMVALAVGTLCGSSLLFLIPEAFMLVHDDSSDYIWKSTTIIGGIYLFYLTEKIMRMINSKRENTNLKKRKDELATQGAITTSFRRVPIDNNIPGKDPSQISESLGGICSSPSVPHMSLHSSSSSEISSHISPKKSDQAIDDIVFSVYNSKTEDSHVPSFTDKPDSNGIGHGQAHHSTEIAPVAYMIIFGDALHNFIDGLSIGSAFTQSIISGISVSVAVMCEELPHELGDFAILLNSGMRFKKALMYNFLSACTCYLGNIVGILLGENTQSHEWIFAVAGGMFLYISLVDMMPEMNTAAETEGKQFGEKKTLILQNCGLLTGYSVMLVFALFGDNISFR